MLFPHEIIVCRQIHALATLPNYVHMHLMNTNFEACLYLQNIKFVFILMQQGLSFPLNTLLSEASFPMPNVAVKRKSKWCWALPEFFSCCVPHCKELHHLVSAIWQCSLFCSQNSDPLYVQYANRISVLSWMSYISVGRFQKIQTRGCIMSLTQINIGNYWLHYDIIIFP